LANISITLEGIHTAAAHLNYRPGAVKQKALAAILSFYTTEDAIQSLHRIDTDTLVKAVWDVGTDRSKIKSKRRNFFSLKSAINADLRRLSSKDKNPENIMITDANIFDMTADAKNNLLSSFSDAIKTGDVDLQQATDILKTLTDFLDEFQADEKTEASRDIIEQIKNLLTRISRGVPPDDTQTHDSEGDSEESMAESDDLFEEVDEIDADEDLVEVEEQDEEEELVALDTDEELVELDEDQDTVSDETDSFDEDDEITVLDEDEELVELDEEEALDEELETVDEQDLSDGVEEIETLDGDDGIAARDEDAEEIALEEDEELVELDEEELDEDVEEIVLEDDEDLEEVDELSDEELQALEDFRKKQAQAEEFDDALGEREKKFNAYVKVPGGIYTVGTKQGGASFNLELQQFDMPEVYMGRYPVTNALFEIFIDNTGYQTTAEKTGFGTVFSSRFKRSGSQASWHKSRGSKQVKGACWYQPHGPGSSLHKKRNHPVVQVSVEDAFAYASWIGRRLPTQAEWEAAARTDLGCRYPWGNDFAVQALNIEDSGLADTSPVDAFEMHANAFTIVDMLGNVMEWTADVEMPPAAAGGSSPLCVAKGGAWNSGSHVTLSSRALYKTGFTANTIGFRCISELFL
jgi:formylglycine-generating enzyme required for sulfatase activity